MCFIPGSSVPSNNSAQDAAQQARKDEKKREKGLSKGNDAISSAFGSYDDNYYNGLAGQYKNYYEPQLQHQYSDATQNALFNAARAGIVNSSAAAKTNADLARSHGEQEQAILSGAQSYANNARQQIGSQRSAAQNMLQASGGNYSDTSGLSQVQAPALPALTPLGDLFTNIAGVASNQARVQAFRNGSNGVVSGQPQNQGNSGGSASRWIT